MSEFINSLKEMIRSSPADELQAWLQEAMENRYLDVNREIPMCAGAVMAEREDGLEIVTNALWDAYMYCRETGGLREYFFDYGESSWWRPAISYDDLLNIFLEDTLQKVLEYMLKGNVSEYKSAGGARIFVFED